MGLKEFTKELNLSRLIIEAVLIFASVYGAFLLEDRRSRNFERKIFRDKLIAHLKVMKFDSTTFEQRLGSSETFANVGLEESIVNHRKVLQLLESGSKQDLLGAYRMHKEGKLFWRIIQSQTKSQHQLESILENYEHLLQNDSTLYYIKEYIYLTWVINQFASWADNQLDKVDHLGYENYFVLSPQETEEDILKYVSHPFYYNGIRLHLEWIEALKNFKRDYDEDYQAIKRAIFREIDAQNALM